MEYLNDIVTTGRAFALGWFLSAAWLMLIVQLSCQDKNNPNYLIQSVMIAMWVAIGVIMFVVS